MEVEKSGFIKAFYGFPPLLHIDFESGLFKELLVTGLFILFDVYFVIVVLSMIIVFGLSNLTFILLTIIPEVIWRAATVTAPLVVVMLN